MKDVNLINQGWMIPVLRAMKASGIDELAASATLKFDVSNIEQIESKFSSKRLTRLIQFCNKGQPLNNFSIEIGRQFHPGMFHALGYAMLSSCSLGKAFECIARYKSVVSNTCSLDVTEGENRLYLNMSIFTLPESSEKVISFEITETFLASMVQFSRILVGDDTSPRRVRFSYPQPSYSTQYLNDFFGCEVEFNCRLSGLEYDLEQASNELPGANILLSQATEQILNELIIRADKEDLVNTVVARIHTLLPSGEISQESIAGQLNMSLRNLQRKLEARGVNYKSLLDDTRKSLALDYLRLKHLSLNDICLKVGYTNISNFNRAFKRWTGMSPGEYRSEHLR